MLPVPVQRTLIPPEVVRQKIEEQEARERRREQQQGMGRPIIGTEFGGRQFVAVGSTMHWGKWKTFFDFLSDHIKQTLGGDWGNAEIAKPLSERHPVMRWYDAVCSQVRTESKPDSHPQSWHTAIETCPRWTTSTVCGWQQSSWCAWSRRCTAVSIARATVWVPFGVMAR